MGGGSKSSTQQTQASTSSNTVDPQELAMLQANYTGAQQRADSLTPYSGQLTAGFAPTQTQAQGVLSGIGTDPSYTASNDNAIGSVQGILSNPTDTTVTATPTTANGVTANTVTAGLLKDTDLTPYMNPFQKSVIDASVADNERARQISGVADAQKTAAASAFGGSRSGVLSSLTNGEYDRNDQTNIANLNSANFDQAQAAATGDINRTLSADTTNAENKLNADEYTATNAANTGQFNANQDTNAQQQSIADRLAQQGLQINAAGQIVALNNANLGTAATQGGILASVGDAQQAQTQTELANAYQAYMAGTQLTQAQQQMLNSALGLIPNQQTVATSGNSTGNTQTSTDASLGGVLGSLGSLGMGLGKSGLGLAL